MKLIRIAAALLLLPLIAACSMPGTTKSTIGCSKINPSLCVERMDITGTEGATTYNFEVENGQIVDVKRVFEHTTHGQDMQRTFVGAATPSIINGAVALTLDERKARRCANGGCNAPSNVVHVSGGTAVANSGSTSASTTHTTVGACGNMPCAKLGTMD